jgi:hypothetical protein
MTVSATSQIGEKITIEATLVSVIELFTNEYGNTIFVNTLRTRDGKILTYKGKDLSDDYTRSCGFPLGVALTSYQAKEKFDVSVSLTDRYYAFFEKENFVTVAATVKDFTTYKGQQQTVIQRPKLQPLQGVFSPTLTAKEIKAIKKAEKTELLEVEALVVDEIGYMPKFKKNGITHQYQGVAVIEVSPKLYKLTYQVGNDVLFGGYFFNLRLAKAIGVVVMLETN